MNDFEEKLFKKNYHKKILVDKDNFLNSLHLKIKKTEEKRKLNNAYYGIIVLFLFLNANYLKNYLYQQISFYDNLF